MSTSNRRVRAIHLRLSDEEDTALRFVQKSLGLTSGQDVLRYAVRVLARSVEGGKHKIENGLLRTTVR